MSSLTGTTFCFPVSFFFALFFMDLYSFGPNDLFIVGAGNLGGKSSSFYFWIIDLSFSLLILNCFFPSIISQLL